MIKKKIRICIILIIILFILLGVIYLIDIYRMKNNLPVIFSTWGYDYAPPETIYHNKDDNSSNINKSYFYGKILESKSNYILVEPNQGEAERRSSDKISIGLGNENDTLYPIGTNVKITYDGYILESYPAQINASKIELVSKLELMYETIIDDIMKQDEGLNNNAQYISLDIDSFVGIEESKKDTLLRYCKKYNNDIKEYSMQELKDNGLFNEKELRIDGILIYVESVEKLTENSAIITVVKYRSGLGAIFPKYKLTYKNNSWNIEVLQMAIS